MLFLWSPRPQQGWSSSMVSPKGVWAFLAFHCSKVVIRLHTSCACLSWLWEQIRRKHSSECRRSKVSSCHSHCPNSHYIRPRNRKLICATGSIFMNPLPANSSARRRGTKGRRISINTLSSSLSLSGPRISRKLLNGERLREAAHRLGLEPSRMEFPEVTEIYR